MTNKLHHGSQGAAYAVAGGIISSLIIGAIGCCCIALMIATEKVKYEQMGYYIMAITFLAAWISAVISAHKQKGKKLLVCFMTGIGMYLLYLCIGFLMSDGPIKGAGETLLLTLGAATAVALVGKNRKRKPIRGHKRS